MDVIAKIRESIAKQDAIQEQPITLADILRVAARLRKRPVTHQLDLFLPIDEVAHHV